MTTFYAQPYSLEHTGFYFEDLESYEQKMEKLESQGCEEIEIQFIDGETYHAKLAKTAQISQCDIELWFDELEDLGELEIESLCYLLDCGYSLKDSLERYPDVNLYKGSASDYARELFEECYEIPEYLQFYIDYDAVARDMMVNSEIIEVGNDLIVTNSGEF